MATQPRKITRKTSADRDEFRTFTQKLTGYAKRNQRTLVTAAGAGLFLVIALVILVSFIQRTERKAYNLLRQPEAMYINHMSGQDKETPVESIIAGFSEVVKAYPRTDAGRAARVYLGELYAESDQWAKAEEQYQEALPHFVEDPMMARILRLGLAYAYEGQGKLDQAAEEFKGIVDAGDKAMREDALLGLGRAYEALGRSAEAHEAWRTYIREYPDSIYVQMLREKLPPETAAS